MSKLLLLHDIKWQKLDKKKVTIQWDSNLSQKIIKAYAYYTFMCKVNFLSMVSTPLRIY